MNCKTARPLFYDYTKGEVSPSEKAGLESHLSGCEVCNSEFDSIKDIKKLFSAGLINTPSRVINNLRGLYRPVFLKNLRPVLAFAAGFMLIAGIFTYNFITITDAHHNMGRHIYDSYSVMDSDSYEIQEQDYPVYLVNDEEADITQNEL